ncbi:MAG: glycosyltransferase [Sphingobacterium sp.]|jgi:glycosyltransferase involved in cell wall biosynthesis|uniref:glycosyltransferase family 2 protein n=1 Tax=Sphingobacterium sp. TaxID=341027 RepID=UPI00283F7F71|nr:glycosyltransferase [Sphingobacterium sp.]MDR3010496.1 glycosyltransferase [Sphingobacterium sp.]
MKKIAVSIIIPLFNNSEHVLQTLESVCLQTYTNWECIIIDDGSTDGSIGAVQKLISNDSRFTLLKRSDLTTIKGANVCRNIGLKQAKSEWLIFVDADDYLAIDCLYRRLQYIQSNRGFDFYVFKTAFVNDAGTVMGTFCHPDNNLQNLIFGLIKHQIPWHTMSPVWNVKFLQKIGGWNETFERLQDVELSIRALLHAPSFRIDNGLIDSFYRSNGMTPQKIAAARMGFCRLIKDCYFDLMNSKLLDESCKEEIVGIFQAIIEGQLYHYIVNNAEDKNWEALYLKTLDTLEMEEYTSVKKLFETI